MGKRQKELADMLDVTVPAISDIENGRNKLSNEMSIKLLERLNINMNYILGGKGEMFLKMTDNAGQVSLSDVANTIVRILDKAEGEIKKELKHFTGDKGNESE